VCENCKLLVIAFFFIEIFDANGFHIHLFNVKIILTTKNPVASIDLLKLNGFLALTTGQLHDFRRITKSTSVLALQNY
jgi:hypothetical protein